MKQITFTLLALQISSASCSLSSRIISPAIQQAQRLSSYYPIRSCVAMYRIVKDHVLIIREQKRVDDIRRDFNAHIFFDLLKHDKPFVLRHIDTIIRAAQKIPFKEKPHSILEQAIAHHRLTNELQWYADTQEDVEIFSQLCERTSVYFLGKITLEMPKGSARRIAKDIIISRFGK